MPKLHVTCASWQQKAPQSQATLMPDPTCGSRANCPGSGLCLNSGTQLVTLAPCTSWSLIPSYLSCPGLLLSTVPSRVAGPLLLLWHVRADVGCCWCPDSAVVCKEHSYWALHWSADKRLLLIMADHGNFGLKLCPGGASSLDNNCWAHYTGVALLESVLSVPSDNGALHRADGDSNKSQPHEGNPLTSCSA